jgi:radical SAM superfamily enzyme YgiQ (UPF0313 family)
MNSASEGKNCDVILISPPARRYSPYLPLGLLCLSSYLKKNGLSSKIIYFTMELRGTALYLANRLFSPKVTEVLFGHTIIKEILARKPVLVGISCCTAEYPWTMKMAQEIKNRVNVPIVIGGIHPTLKPEDFIFKGSPVDFAVIGEGETPLMELTRAIKLKTPLSSLKHISYLSPDGSLVTATCNIEPDISGFPAPDYGQVDMSYFTIPVTKHIRNIPLSGVEIITSRGCPYGCEFCANNFLVAGTNTPTTVRNRDINQVVEELRYLASAFAIDGFYILDDCFLLSQERVADFCEKLLKSRLKLVWAAETRVNLLRNEDLLRLMKKAGLVQLDFGVESGSPEMLEEIKKGITVEQTRKAFELCRRNGIRTFANIMFNLPHETVKDINLTEQLLDEIKPTVVSMMLTVPFLGTRIYEKYVFPELTAAEYDIFNKNAFSEIPDKRFFLASHDLDFKQLLTRLGNKYNKPAQNICFSPLYWNKILFSRHFFSYVLIFVLAPLDMAIGLLVMLDARIMNNLLRNTVRRFKGTFGQDR